MPFVSLFLLLILLAHPFPADARSEALLIPEDQFVAPGAKTYLSARLERTGLWPGKRALAGERIEFLVEGTSLGSALTDAGGTASRAHVFPSVPGIYPFTVRLHSREYQAVEASGLVAVWDKKKPILAVLLEGAAIQIPPKRTLPLWQEKPYPPVAGSSEALTSLARRAQILYLTRRDESHRHTLKKWLGEHRFAPAPLFSWPGSNPLERRPEDLAALLEHWKSEGWDLRLGVGSNPSDAKAFREAGMAALLLTKEEDEEPEGTLRAPTWKEALPQIRKALATKKGLKQ